MSEFLRRSREDWVHVFLALLPEGPIWPRHAAGLPYSTVYALMGIVHRWAERVATFLLIEAFPPSSLELLTDWERVLGLPEPCVADQEFSIAERQQAVREKLQRRPGRQDRYYMIERAAALGYDITLTEYAMAQAGISRAGDSTTTEAEGRIIVDRGRAGDPRYRFVWRITISGPRLTWFRAGAGGGRAGEDPHLRIARAEDLECILNEIKPAHTKLIFAYTGV